jgi:isopenicillin N synthase-like dioxygenase
MLGCEVVNLGDMMKRMTAGVYKSSVHRVVNTSEQHRYSVPMFLDGNLDFVITPVVDGPSSIMDRLTVEEHMMERFGSARDRIKSGITTGA